MPRPTPQPPDGDAQFLGVNQADPPAMLPPGVLAAARNNRCRHGRAEPRLGPVKLPWTNKVTSGASSTPIPFGTIYGTGEFLDADAVKWGIVAADGGVYRFREGNGSAPVTLPPGVTITAPVEFEQTYSGLVMFRGPDADPLIMASLDTGFASVVQEANVVTGATSENPSDGTESIPPAARGSFINGRLFIPYATATEKDLVAISDYSNATRYAPVRSQGRINQGSSDELVRVLKFGNSEVAVCFKTGSVYQLSGISGSLSDMTQDEITREFGLAAPLAAINVGKDEADAPDEVWFLANRRGIMRLTPDAGTGRLGVQSVPVSREVGDIIERTNWEAISGATFAVWDNKFYGALPIDDARLAGPEILRGSLSYGVGYTQPVVPGGTYRYTQGASDTSLSNGTETLSDSGEFTAQGGSVTFFGSGDFTASLRRVWTDCNNCVVVFDFERGLWAGVDDGTAMQVKAWLNKLPFSGEQRLFYFGEDGFINCHEWAFDDQPAYESYGANLVSGGDETTASFTPVTTPGRSYIYDLRVDAGTVTLQNGTELITITNSGSGRFVAQTTSVLVTKVSGLWTLRFVHLLDWTLDQEDIDHDVTLRGFSHGTLGRKRGLWARFHFRSWYPSLSVSEVTEGVEEEIMRLTDETKSRIRYTKNLPDYDPTNYNDDHATAHREDYAVVLQDNTVASGAIEAGVRYLVESVDVTTACSITYNSVTVNNGETFVGVAGVTTFTVASGSPLVKPPDSYAFFDGDGIDPDLHQEWAQDVRLHSHGRARQFRVRNQQGRCELVALELFSKDTDQRPGKRT